MPSQLMGSDERIDVRETHGQEIQAKTSLARAIGASVRKRIGSQKYTMWFGRADLRVTNTLLQVATDSQFVANWIDSHFGSDLDAAAQESLGPAAQVDVRVDPNLPGDRHAPLQADGRQGGQRGPASSKVAPQNGRHELQPAEGGRAAVVRSSQLSAPSDRVPADHSLRRRMVLRRLDSFVVGESNRLAYSAALRLAEDPEAGCISPLFIHGECGVGKTHLLQGVCQRFIDTTGRRQQVRYVTGEQFTNEYIAAIRANTIEEFRKRLRKLDLLAIDDVHFLSNKVRTQTEFLYTLEAIGLSGARIALASDNSPHNLKRFSQALVSRFMSGMVVKVDEPDRPTRIALIHRLASARHLRLNAAAVQALAANCIGSVRELEGAMTKLAAFKMLMNGDAAQGDDRPDADEVGLTLVERLFRQRGLQPGSIIRLAAIIDAVCARMAVTRSDLFGSSRHRRIVLARALVAYLSRELTTHSFPEIAQALGRNNHSTIHTADQRLRTQLNADAVVDLGPADGRIALRELIDQVRRDLARASH